MNPAPGPRELQKSDINLSESQFSAMFKKIILVRCIYLQLCVLKKLKFDDDIYFWRSSRRVFGFFKKIIFFLYGIVVAHHLSASSFLYCISFSNCTVTSRSLCLSLLTHTISNCLPICIKLRNQCFIALITSSAPLSLLHTWF